MRRHGWTLRSGQAAGVLGGLWLVLTWTNPAWADPQLPTTYGVNALVDVSANYRVGIYSGTDCAITADLGDGATATATFTNNGDGTFTGTVDHAYAVAGLYLVTAGPSNLACASLVQDLSEIVTVATPYTVEVGQPLQLTFGIYSDTSCTVTADFGDGSTGPTTYVADPNGGYRAVATHTYTAAGTYLANTPDGENCPSAGVNTAPNHVIFPDTSQVTVVAASSGSGGSPSPAGTPEVDSLVLFGAGLLAAGGYVCARQPRSPNQRRRA